MIRTTTTRHVCAYFLFVTVALVTVPAAAAQQRDSVRYAATNLSDVPLAPGDMIRLHFEREPTLNGDYFVDEHGRVALPILGVRYVSAMAPGALQPLLLRDYYQDLKNQIVDITMFRRVRILGAVREPGIYHVNATMTLADALALAGGATPDGKLSGVKILRNHDEIRLDLDRVSYLKQLRSGDQILVPERSWLARHSGIVVGGLLSAATIFVAQAIAR